MPTVSAGILLHHQTRGGLEVLLVHPGGPYWAGRDEGAWTIPKGEVAPGEEPLAAANREVEEEIGLTVEGALLELTPVRQRGGKLVHAWAAEGDFDPGRLHSNTFTLEWPPRSGRRPEFAEVDRAAWFTLEAARRMIMRGQVPLLSELARKLGPPPA